MISLHSLFVPKNYEHASLVFEPVGINDHACYCRVLDLVKMVVTNAKLAGKAFLKRNYSAFDPIVHENSCQIRGSMMISMAVDRGFRREAYRLTQQAAKIETTLKTFFNKRPVPDTKKTLEEVVSDHQLELQVSPQMGAAILSYFLTLGKVFRIYPDGREVAYIDFHTLKDRTSKRVDPELVKAVVDAAQVRLAEFSVAFIQREASRLRESTHPDARFIEEQLVDGLIEKVAPPCGLLLRPCSLAFYNFKTILLRAAEERTVVLVKQYAIKKEKTFGVFFQAEDPSGPFLPLQKSDLREDHAVFVIEGMVPNGMGEKELQQEVCDLSLVNLALANVATVPQYSRRDPEKGKLSQKATNELREKREEGIKLGLNVKNPKTFTIVHTHASSIKEELACLA